MGDKIQQDGTLTVEEVEWNRLKNSRITEGFADGKFQGGESTLQSGFDQGYAEGFKITLPISVIKGLLAVNEIILKEKNSPLLHLSSDLKQSLEKFERKCSDLNLKNLISDNGETDGVEVNKNSCLPVVDRGNENAKGCVVLGGDITVFGRQVFEVLEDLKKLRRNITNFIIECNQPVLLDQVMNIFECWNLQDIPEENLESTDLLQSSSDRSVYTFPN